MSFNNTFFKDLKAKIASLLIMQPHTEKNNVILECWQNSQGVTSGSPNQIILMPKYFVYLRLLHLFKKQ